MYTSQRFRGQFFMCFQFSGFFAETIEFWTDYFDVKRNHTKKYLKVHCTTRSNLGPVVRSLVSANRWLRGIKTYRFPWYLTLVSANHASSNPGLIF